MNHIELFSGCGGLSLGLKKAGYHLTLANELSPMAAESFAYNFFNEDLEDLANNNLKPQSTYWLTSNTEELKPRLRENPFKFPLFDDGGFSDIPKDQNLLEGKLVVGSIVELNKLLDSDKKLVKLLKTSFRSTRGLDLVSGGPPCQSFSMAGLRRLDCDKNSLPWEFAKFVQHTQPKIAMLENVTGNLRAFKDEDGNSFHAWYEVAKAFATINYVPLCLHINARVAGIAQNRPRFIMIAVRHDYYKKISKGFSPESSNTELFSESVSFFDLVQTTGNELEFGHLNYFDVMKPYHRQLIDNSFLRHLIDAKPTNIKEALDDLKQFNPSEPSEYINRINSYFDFLPERSQIFNHELRRNSDLVKRRFRLYQVLGMLDQRFITTAIFDVLKGKSKDIDDDIWNACKKYKYLHQDGKLRKFITKENFLHYLLDHPTKKQTQKALKADKPAPAALSIPDDACHYDEEELRVLTVREMARIQSFPDNFVFRSKITTGGQMRKFEVPQYTQVGNAVPPLLGLKLGECLKELLIEKSPSKN